ncbi:MAG: cytochrome c biogenesis protein [Proteobacteria bacterium]|nr:cytochrome c biogenesis protein [Pseudomonadota bacterium]MBU1716556.1 cytochrome c biogenesis protein [Pseudomonadota bacterium]
MPTFLDPTTFSLLGNYLLLTILVLGGLLGISGTVNLFRPAPVGEKISSRLLIVITSLLVVGFIWICWFHYQIHTQLSLELPQNLAVWLNRQLAAANSNASYAMPLYDLAHPPRYSIPVWIENEKYYFWFMCYAILGLSAHYRMRHHRFRGAVHLILAIQTTILYFFTNPFAAPLPKFMAEISPWFNENLSDMARAGLFMKLYPKMIFYYNAHYMWLHPPMLFLSYACITLTFITSLFMLVKRDLAIENLGYDFAKLGFFMLTLGMLLGYPWALQAWGPNWWWDPKICSSIMMWAVFSTYLHTRLYANKPAMWYFSSILGILCFAAMIFTFLATFFFPGEHTFQ